jgi:hypothetical protein
VSGGGQQQFAVHVPTADLARQTMLSVSASVIAAVEQTRGGCTSAAEAYPGWSTSAALRSLHSAHITVITSHARDLGGHADHLGTSVDAIREADRIIGESIAAALNHHRS